MHEVYIWNVFRDCRCNQFVSMCRLSSWVLCALLWLYSLFKVRVGLLERQGLSVLHAVYIWNVFRDYRCDKYNSLPSLPASNISQRKQRGHSMPVLLLGQICLRLIGRLHRLYVANLSAKCCGVRHVQNVSSLRAGRSLFFKRGPVSLVPTRTLQLCPSWCDELLALCQCILRQRLGDGGMQHLQAWQIREWPVGLSVRRAGMCFLSQRRIQLCGCGCRVPAVRCGNVR